MATVGEAGRGYPRGPHDGGDRDDRRRVGGGDPDALSEMVAEYARARQRRTVWTRLGWAGGVGALGGAIISVVVMMQRTADTAVTAGRAAVEAADVAQQAAESLLERQVVVELGGDGDIVEFQGTLRVEAHPDGGTLFRFIVPTPPTRLRQMLGKESPRP